MSESNIQQNGGKPNDEIDIFEFSVRIWKAFKNFLIGIGNLIVSIIVFLIRKALWIVSFALFGMILGYVFYSVSKPYYISSLEGNTGGVDNSVVIDHIKKLNQVINKPSLLANHLSMSIEQAKEIRNIKAYYGIDINRDGRSDYVDFDEKYNPRDTMQRRVPSFVHIRVSLYDESILPELRKALFRYVNNNTYIQNLHRIDREQNEALVKELAKEISKIDTLQRVRIRKESASDRRETTFHFNNEPEIKLFYQDILTLHNQKQTIEKSLELYKEPIVVVQDFSSLEQEERPLLKYIIVLGGLMAVLGIFCALCWQYRKRIWELIREDSTNR